MADSDNLGDDVDVGGSHNVHVEIIAIFRALSAHTELNFPCLPIRQLTIS